MTNPDDIFDQATGNIERLGLSEIPFTESPTDLKSDALGHIFTGRETELRQVFNLFQSRERRRVLIYGRLGIGKSAFLLEILSVLRRKRPKMLTAYMSLPPELDLATTALIALAQEMADDEWVQRQLYQMGIPTAKVFRERRQISEHSGLSARTGHRDLLISNPQYPTVNLNTLLDRAQEKYPDGVVIAIDDLDKQNPSRVRQLMHDAQGLLKGRAWFLLTGHPMGMTGDLLTSERGLFDLQLKLEELDLQTTYKMLINYLNSVRVDHNCTDPENPDSVAPFLPETAMELCKVSQGKPRLFNRLGGMVLSAAADLQVEKITLGVLEQALNAAKPTLVQQAALNAQEERVRMLLEKRGSLSDDDITMADLEQLGFRSFSEILPYLERLEETDLAYQLNLEDAKAFAPIPLPSPDI